MVLKTSLLFTHCVEPVRFIEGGKKLKLYGWGLVRGKRGNGEGKQWLCVYVYVCVCVCVCWEFKAGWVYSVSHSQITPGLCVKALSGNVFVFLFLFLSTLLISG